MPFFSCCGKKKKPGASSSTKAPPSAPSKLATTKKAPPNGTGNAQPPVNKPAPLNATTTDVGGRSPEPTPDRPVADKAGKRAKGDKTAATTKRPDVTAADVASPVLSKNVASTQRTQKLCATPPMSNDDDHNGGPQWAGVGGALKQGSTKKTGKSSTASVGITTDGGVQSASVSENLHSLIEENQQTRRRTGEQVRVKGKVKRAPVRKDPSPSASEAGASKTRSAKASMPIESSKTQDASHRRGKDSRPTVKHESPVEKTSTSRKNLKRGTAVIESTTASQKVGVGISHRQASKGGGETTPKASPEVRESPLADDAGRELRPPSTYDEEDEVSNEEDTLYDTPRDMPEHGDWLQHTSHTAARR